MSLTTIPVTFAKSHLATLGSRLYSQSLDLVRELVANAWDADATKVSISILEKSLVIHDTGSGMDQLDLRQYFTIGSSLKRDHPLTPIFKRVRIGEFGIGKFAPLSLCDRFELYTKKGQFAATVIFDKTDFESSPRWEVPILVHRAPAGQNGTKITLVDLKIPIDSLELERKLRHQLPLREKNFSVFINGIQLTPRHVPGRRFRLHHSTSYGLISGEIIISALMLAKEDQGIAIKTKGMLIKRDWFGLDHAHDLAKSRITGEVSAHFLPVTSGRDNFITTSPEYQTFSKILTLKLRQVAKTLRLRQHLTKNRKQSQALSQALQHVRQALKKNGDIFLLHDLPLFSQQTDQRQSFNEAVTAGVATANLASAKTSSTLNQAKVGKIAGSISRKLPAEIRQRVQTVLHDRERLVKKINIGGSHVVCSLASLGQEEIESFSEGGVIFINRDHTLFTKAETNDTVLAWHLARLLTQELALLAQPASASQAYEWQSRLLKDALRI